MEIISWNKRTWVASILFRGGNHVESAWLEPVLKVAGKLAATGSPVPWLGLLADLWTLIGTEERLSNHNDLNPELLRHPSFLDYQDMVLARCSQDAGLNRIRRAISGRAVDRKIEALLFLLESWTDAGICTGIPVTTGFMVSLAADCHSLEKISRGIIEDDGWPQELTNSVRSFSQGFRSLSFPIDSGVAGIIEKGLDIVDRAPRIQLRQIASAQADLEELVIKRFPRQRESFHLVIGTEVADGAVPLGGYYSISTRGRLESLLPSQIAWLDLSVGESNYFLIKHRRKELLYYNRSENLLFKGIRNIIFLIDKSLKGSRTKYPDLPCQAMTLLMASFLSLWEQLKEKLSMKDLALKLMFVDSGQDFKGEMKLLEMMFSSEILEGRVRIVDFDPELISTWMSQVESEPVNTQIIYFIGESSIHKYQGESRRITRILLKGSELISLNNLTSEQNTSPVWPDRWAETITNLSETLAVS